MSQRKSRITKRQRQILRKAYAFSPETRWGERYPIWEVRVLRLTDTGWEIVEKLQKRGYLNVYRHVTPKGLVALR